MIKKLSAVFFASVLMLSPIMVQSAYANYSKQGSQRAHSGHGAKMGMNIESMFFHKAHAVLENKKELALTEEQVKTIRGLKIDLMKSLIQQNAEIDLTYVDLHAHMWLDPMDKDAIGQLIERKHQLKVAKAKSIVDALDRLNTALTPEQKEKLKEMKGKH